MNTFSISKGKQLYRALEEESPLQVVGTMNAMTALLAQKAGFKALYLSGAGIANAAFGLPDLGVTTLTEVSEEIRRITGAVSLPLLVDGDTGFGSTLTIQRMIRQFSAAGAAGVHIEDQCYPKRCGHREGKKVVSVKVMQDRLKAAVDAREDRSFILMARTDAMGIGAESLSETVDRIVAYVEAGADMIFAEAVTSLSEYQAITEQVSVPVLANMTEFGKTPLFSVSELKAVGIKLVLYPLTAFRAMNKAALQVYEVLRREGSQKGMLEVLQTRSDLYDLLNYEELEAKL